ncbi:T-complex protein 1 subunit theta-like [Artemia franciscana]|uniref:T-complex protein 1 subunit theta n=1 Tax=Artemia franciscana TaxID=6661 RepID=A0AA88HSB4_ARTSF|nr:hypothetical protein QYM36_009779 [Artemia franciscana]
MALHVPKAPGFGSMLKEGAKFFSGVEEAVIRNISACKEFAQTVRTVYGPHGMNKMVINHLDKLFVTNDAATIIRELEVEHPAAKIMVLASQMQEQEVGDGTNFVIIFAGALLEAAESLIKTGLNPTDIADGFEKALEKALEILPTLVCHEIKDYRNEEEVTKGLKTSIMSKQFGNEDFLSKLIAKACVSILPEKTTFNVDNVRVCKISGSGLTSSSVVQGMVFKRLVEGSVSKKEKAKIAVYTCPVDTVQTETKGTVLIKTAQELKDFSKGEESLVENEIKALKEAGVDVIVAGGKVGELCLHFINKYEMMAVRLNSKFDVRRIAKTTGATALPRLTVPTPEEMGYCDLVYTDEIGDTMVVVFRNESKESRVSTVILRGATEYLLDDVERAVDDGINTFKCITRDGRFVPGAAATEIELARQIAKHADTCPGLEQYAIKKFAQALEVFPRTLAENTGVKPNEVLSRLYAAHEEGKKSEGFDIEGEGLNFKDAVTAGFLDLFVTKHWALKYATNAACTIIRVDQIIMAKRAGGPQARPAGPQDADED